jgi:hypothetical protein
MRLGLALAWKNSRVSSITAEAIEIKATPSSVGEGMRRREAGEARTTLRFPGCEALVGVTEAWGLTKPASKP